MNKRGIEDTKQKKNKKELNEEEKQDKLRKKKVKIASKLEKIETSVDEIIDIIDKDGIEIEEKEKPEEIIILGDLYYHGPRNELSQEYEPMKVAKILNSMKEKLTVIRGNCDAEVDEMISEFQFHDYVLKEINGKKIYFTHGHKYNIEKIPYEEFEIMIYGHTHQGFIEEKEGYIFANPGSISLPKCNTEHSYIILEENKIILKNVDGKIIKEYEIK